MSQNPASLHLYSQSEHFSELLLPACFLTILGRLGKDMRNGGKISHPYQVFILPLTQNAAHFCTSVMIAFARRITSHASLENSLFNMNYHS